MPGRIHVHLAKNEVILADGPVSHEAGNGESLLPLGAQVSRNTRSRRAWLSWRWFLKVASGVPAQNKETPVG